MIYITRGEVNTITLSLPQRHAIYGTPASYVIRFRNLQDTEVIEVVPTVVGENTRATTVTIDAEAVNFKPADYEYIVYGVYAGGVERLFQRGIARIDTNNYTTSPILEANITVRYESGE